MHTPGGADRIGGADPSRASVPMWRPGLGSGGVRRGILTAGIAAGIHAGARIRDVTGAIGIAAEALQNVPMAPRCQRRRCGFFVRAAKPGGNVTLTARPKRSRKGLAAGDVSRFLTARWSSASTATTTHG